MKNREDDFLRGRIDFTNATDKARHDGMVELVKRMLGLQKSLSDAKGKTGQKET